VFEVYDDLDMEYGNFESMGGNKIVLQLCVVRYLQFLLDCYSII
jgi:hypothetical protein